MFLVTVLVSARGTVTTVLMTVFVTSIAFLLILDLVKFGVSLGSKRYIVDSLNVFTTCLPCYLRMLLMVKGDCEDQKDPGSC